MSQSKITEKIFQQQNNLIEKIPNLKNYFIDIYIPQWNSTIPFLPIRCFRDFDLHSQFTEQTSEQYKIFLSSGSTGHKRSRHILSPNALKNYAINTCKGFSRFLAFHGYSKSTPIISLVPPSKVWPTSSLAAMIEMFADDQFSISWCDIDENKENLIHTLASISNQTSCLIFGTTFHHLMLANDEDQNFKKNIQEQFKRLDISIVDTGGTKGRTRALTLEQSIETLKSFYCSPNFSFFSEYGMCELGSQAWSSKKIHDGSFACNETLFSFAVSLDKKCALSKDEVGFLCFIDIVNEESYGCIITEDIGYVCDSSSFKLLGRGPDASIKGCSLNVRNHFTFDKSEEKFEVVHSGNLNLPIKLVEICSILENEKKWDHFSIEDFKTMAASIEGKISPENLYNHKNFFIISAANTPIAWLFPYLIAACSHAQSVTIKVPSLRLDDYFAENMIEKTKDLIEVISRYFPNTKTYIDSNKSLARNFEQYDIVLAFGTDETIQTIQSQINVSKTLFIGKGDIKNSLVLETEKSSPHLAVQYCSYWNGRGCLTPVALFLQGSFEGVTQWSNEFSAQLEADFSERLQLVNTNFVASFVHAHNAAYVSAQIKQLGLNEKEIVKQGRFTCVVNLSHVSPEKLQEFNPEFGFGGCGFVFLLPWQLRNKFLNSLYELPVLPAIVEF